MSSAGLTAPEPAPGGADEYPPLASAFGLLAVLALATIVGNIDRQILTLIVAPIRSEFGVSDTQVGLLYGLAFSLCFALAGLPLGRMIDRRDRRVVLAFGIAAWSLATMACGLAQTFTQLFAARMGVGIGEACLAPATYSLVSDLFRREHLGRAGGVLGASTTVGAGLSLIIGGGLLKLFGEDGVTLPLVGTIASWRAIFLLIGPPGLLVALLLLAFREPARKTSVRLESSVADIASDNYVAFFKANAVVLVPILVASLANIFAASGAVAWGPTSLMRRFELAPSSVGLWYGLAMMVGGLTGPLLGGLLSDHWVRRGRFLSRMRLFLLGAPICVAGQLLLCLSPWAPLAIVGQAINTTATAALSTAGLIMVQEVCPNRFRGQTVALMTLTNNILGLGLGPALVAIFSENVFGNLPLAILGLTIPSAAAAVAATLVALSVRKRFQPA